MLLLIVFAVDLISNIDVFYGLKNAFNRFANPDVSLTVSLAAFFAVIHNSEKSNHFRSDIEIFSDR